MRNVIERLRRRTLTVAVLPIALGVALSACTATGMGWIPSNDPTAKATFGFSYDGTTMTFSGSYHDPHGQLVAGDALNTQPGTAVDVAFKGTGKMHPCTPSDPECATAPPTTKGGCLAGEPAYESQNPAIRGGGQLSLIVCDADGNPEVVGDADSLFIQVDTGPYLGYTNSGNPSGNITVKS